MKRLMMAALMAAGMICGGCELVSTGDDNSVDIQDDHSVRQGDAALAPTNKTEEAVAE